MVVMVIVVKVVMVMLVMVMVVEMMIEKRGLIECMHYEKFTSFCNSISHTLTLTYHSHNTSIIAIVYGRQS